MKIECENKSKTPFEDVVIGDVFRYNTDIYMRVDSIDENGTELDVNAVDFFTGELRHIPSYADVKILDATLKLSD